MNNTTKRRVLKRFLAFVGRFISLREAHVATLGGKGVEPQVWEKAGIPAEHGWLIERSRSQGSSLITKHRYRMVNQLSFFPRALAGIGRDSIDAFHLDLDGLFLDKVISNFKSAFELVLKGKARCLAITVADARGNAVFDRWAEYERRSKRIFPQSADSLAKRFLEEQERMPRSTRKLPQFFKLADPLKGAKRELGFLVDFAGFLAGYKTRCVHMERYVYVSRYSERPFRMRTYFFHFEASSVRADPQALAQVWQGSPLHFVTESGIQNVTCGPGWTETKTTMTMNERKTMPSGTQSRLESAAHLLGGDALEEYQQLRASHERLANIMTALNATEASVGKAESAKSVPLAGPERGHKKRWNKMDDRAQIQWLIETLELRGKGTWRANAWEDHLKKYFGYYDQDLAATLRASIARTSKKFRPTFIKRIEKFFPEGEARQLIARLEKL